MRINDQEAIRLLVLKTIRREEPLARTDLATLTGLSHATITGVVADLLRRKFLLEAKTSTVGRGRPRIQLMLNPNAARVLSASWLSEGSLNAEIGNMRGERMFRRTSSLGRYSSFEEIAERISRALDETIAASPFEKSRIYGVSVALPATLDNLGGAPHWLQDSPLGATSLAAVIKRKLGLPVTVANSVSLMARAEHWFGEDRQVDDFSLIVVGLGLGAAQYVDGALRAGTNGVSNEFEHVKIALDQGPVCTCGQRGCLAVLATGYGIILRISEHRGQKPPSMLSMPQALAVFAREARAGDSIAREAFHFAGRVLGTAVANHINASLPPRVKVLLLHPEIVDLIAAAFYAAVQVNTATAFRGRIPVELKAAPEVRYLEGTAGMVLERLYKVASD